jgi:hypothetical protein
VTINSSTVNPLSLFIAPSFLRFIQTLAKKMPFLVKLSHESFYCAENEEPIQEVISNLLMMLCLSCDGEFGGGQEK